MTTLLNRELLDEGSPETDSRTFRRCLGQYATGVVVVTARSGEQCAGVTVNSFSSVSLEPPLILWSINKESRSFPVFNACKHFAINVLSKEQIEVSRHFSSAHPDKFVDAQWSHGLNGTPLLDGVITHLECRQEFVYEGGDHAIIVGRVERFARFAGDPLLFVQGQYAVSTDHPDFLGRGTVPSESMTTPASEILLLSLLFRAQQSVSASFDEHRRAEGINLAAGRVLRSVYDNPGIRAETLVRLTFLGERDAEDAIADLTCRSFITRHADGGITLIPDGRRLRETMRNRWEEFQAQQLASISEEDAVCFRRVLTKLLEQNTPNDEAT